MSANPRIFQIIAADNACTALLGTNPVRFFPSGQANKQTPKPYAVYNVVTALPQNYLGTFADIDQKGTQIDIYAATSAQCEQVFNAIRAALEPFENKTVLTNFSTPLRDEETNAYHARMEVDVWESR